VLFGELFGRGYVNGLLDEARKAGMNIVGMTVGRRDENMAAPLNAEELAKPKPTWAAHHQRAADGRLRPRRPGRRAHADGPAGDMTLKSWQDKLDWAQIERCREAASPVSRPPWRKPWPSWTA
jgi:hypothetical protein